MRISNVLGAIGNAGFAVGNECCVEEAVSTAEDLTSQPERGHALSSRGPIIISPVCDYHKS